MNLLAKKIKLHCAQGTETGTKRWADSAQQFTPDALAARTGGGNTAQLLNRTLSCGLFSSGHLLK